MDFQVGDKVIHRTYGLGEILQMDEKELSGQVNRYYVVKIRDLTVWVPTNGKGKPSLRPPTPKSEFKKLFALLSSPGEPLSFDRFERKTQLLEKMREWNLESICQVVRDLTFHRTVKKLNDDDNTILERAKNLLLNEWRFSLLIPIAQAEQELKQLLGGPPH